MQMNLKDPYSTFDHSLRTQKIIDATKGKIGHYIYHQVWFTVI